MTHIAERSRSTVQHLDSRGTRMDFDDFVKAKLHPLIRYATLPTGSRELAEDTVQEALIKAHVKWKRISVMERPEPYVKRIVTNVFLSSKRRRLVRAVELQAAHTDVVQGDRPPSHEQTTADREVLLAEISRAPSAATGRTRPALLRRTLRRRDCRSPGLPGRHRPRIRLQGLGRASDRTRRLAGR